LALRTWQDAVMSKAPDLTSLTLDDFALVARVAELRNLSAVARERAVPPSQVSRALSRIEDRCGARLVHRTTHGLSLSDEGDVVARARCFAAGPIAGTDGRTGSTAR
jgi:hypothetical protein